MLVVNKIDELRKVLKEKRKGGCSVGFVPTMGALHAGHASLIRRSAREHGCTVVSIFVNPSQFNEVSDFEKYPKNQENDRIIAENEGASILFCPEANEIYPDGFETSVIVGQVADTLCGAARPGHFRGVAGIVLKLLNIVQPDDAYFGQKDAQQIAVIKKMVRDLNLDVRIEACPIIRERDGLAMSSRNIFLNDTERSEAVILPTALETAKRLVREGVRETGEIKKCVASLIGRSKLAEVDYIEIVDADTMQTVPSVNGRALLALAVRFGKTRLIDNIMLQVYN